MIKNGLQRKKQKALVSANTRASAMIFLIDKFSLSWQASVCKNGGLNEK